METSTLETSRRGVAWQLPAILIGGLIVRLIMAYGIEGLRGSGFQTDLDLFRYWADSLAREGPFGFYDRGFFADYTPGYLYALWLVGIVGNAMGGIGDLIKLPAIITDVVLAYVVYRMVLDLGVSAGRARLAALVVIVNPVTWFDSVIWGQVDSFGTVFLLLAVRELWKDRPERAAILAVAAALVKPQLAILVPIVAWVVIRRALWPQGAYGDEPEPERTGLPWERRIRGPVRILSTAVAGFLTAVALSAPFGLSVISISSTAPYLESSLLRLIFSTAATYSYVTVNAYNAWALFPLNGESLATNGAWIPDAAIPDATAWAQVGPVPAVLIGAIPLALLLFLVVPWLVARRPDRLTILVGVSALALVFFGVPTRVHERYLYPLFGLGAILFAFSWRWRSAYLLASFATFLNMYVVLTTIYASYNPNVRDWLGIGDAIRSFPGVLLVAVLNTGVLVFGLLQLRRGAHRRLVAELEGARSDEPEPPHVLAQPPEEPGRLSDVPDIPDALLPLPLEAPVAGAAVAPAALGAAPAPSAAIPAPDPDAPARRLPAWFERPSWGAVGPIAWLRSRVGETPIRPDRSRLLHREGGGRLDRLDAWILVVLVIASLGLRMFRVAEPARMHFDEVYHARTATEFLQYWRYGLDHDIYEWTHPHLAKYAMAAGIVLFAGHDVAASSQLGTPVTDAAIEPRREDADDGTKTGDRVWVATGDGVIAYDLHTRKEQLAIPIAGAGAVAFDADGTQLLVGTADGGLWAVDTTLVDDTRRSGGGRTADELGIEPTQLATLDGPITRVADFDSGGAIAAQTGQTTVTFVDPATGTTSGTLEVPGLGEMTSAGTADAVVAVPADVADPDAVAAKLVEIFGGDESDIAGAIRAGGNRVILPLDLTGDARASLEAAINEGSMQGVAIQPVGQLAIAGRDGVTFASPSGGVNATVPIDGGATSVALVSGVDDGTQVYATSPGGDRPEVDVIAVSGEDAKDGPSITKTFPLPGAGSRILYDEASQLVEVLGEAPDGSGQTIYVIEPHGKAVFADHRLDFAPVAWVLDHNGDFPVESRGAILAFGSAGETAAVDVGHYQFSWRMPGVILGALTLGVLYLLARILFRRREVGVLVGLFVLLDGMFFVQSRIAMNDVYVGFFILCAYLLFAWLWLERRGWRWFWALLPVIGVLLGLALASKWVAAYAIGALGILVLTRSALGRLILIAGLVAVTGVLGWMAMAVPSDASVSGNLLFPLIMILLTLAAVGVTVYHPIEWSDDEVRIAVAGPAALGMLIVFAAIATGRAGNTYTVGPLLLNPLAVGFAGVVLGGLAYLAFQVAGRFGIGPMAKAPAPGDARALVEPAAPAADGWLRLGAGLGLPMVWMLACLVALPLAVYVALYLPWAFVDNHQLWVGFPGGHSGQTLVALTQAMYNYHNGLTAAHAASSPWWAWPLNLKPVWFYQGSFAGSTAASIYDAGNMVIWWLGIPAMAFVAWQAFKRRSLALALILVAFLAQWISWARIDRAAFQYHYYTSLPFVVLSLGYFAAELWHGASRRTWLMARAAASLALLGPVLLWLMRVPLCVIANVESVNKGSQACSGNAGNLGMTLAAAWVGIAFIVVIALVVTLVTTLVRKRPDEGLNARDLLPVPMIAILLVSAVLATRLIPSGEPILSVQKIVPEAFAALVGLPLLLVASQILTARDSRRFVLVLIGSAATWFVFLYPNISALPLPSAFTNMYQLLLPTYPYPFQFGVNTIERGVTSFADARFAILMLFLVVACGIVAYSARVWRFAAAEESAARGGSGGPAGEPGATGVTGAA